MSASPDSRLPPASWEEAHPANVCGVARALTVLTPMQRSAVRRLRFLFWLRRRVRWWRVYKAKPLVELSFIHFARWALIDRLAGDEGAPDDRLPSRYLFFESNFNGSFDQYIDAFAYVIPDRMKDIWRGAWGFPGPKPSGPFQQYIRRHEYEASHFYCAYPGATTTQVSAALDLACGLEALVSAAPDLGPEEFVDRWYALLRRPPRREVRRARPRGGPRDRPNVALDGQAYALTVLAPIRPGRERALHDRLAAFDEASPLARVPAIHFARLVVVDHLSHEGPPERHPDLRLAQLLFTCVFDGEPEAFVADLCGRIPRAVQAMWGECVGCPDPAAQPRALLAWLRRHQRDTLAFFAPYGDATVAEVRRSLRLHEAVRRFALETQDRPAADVRAAFEHTFIDSRTGRLR